MADPEVAAGADCALPWRRGGRAPGARGPQGPHQTRFGELETIRVTLGEEQMMQLEALAVLSEVGVTKMAATLLGQAIREAIRVNGLT